MKELMAAMGITIIMGLIARFVVGNELFIHAVTLFYAIYASVLIRKNE